MTRDSLLAVVAITLSCVGDNVFYHIHAHFKEADDGNSTNSENGGYYEGPDESQRICDDYCEIVVFCSLAKI